MIQKKYFKMIASIVIVFIAIVMIFFSGILYSAKILEYECQDEIAQIKLAEHEINSKIKNIKTNLQECEILLKGHMDEKNK